MKCRFFHMVLLFLFALLADAAQEEIAFSDSFPEEETLAEKGQITDGEEANRPEIVFSAILNNLAEIAVRQGGNAGNISFGRRYCPAGFSFEKWFTYLMADVGLLQVCSYKTTLSRTQDYLAGLQAEGYYVYALRKIII